MNRIRVEHGDCLDVMRKMIDAGELVDAIVTDPPYHLTANKRGGSGERSVNPDSPAGRAMATTGFNQQRWDGGDIAFRPETWTIALQLLKPGGHLFAFGGDRRYHRLACAIEDAGFEIRRMFLWMFASGFPKSLNVARAIDKQLGADGEWIRDDHPGRAGARHAADRIIGQTKHDRPDNPDGLRHRYEPATDEARAWNGWGTDVKPAIEPICLARKPFSTTVAENVLQHGVGALNIDACRVTVEDDEYTKNCSGDRGHADNRTRKFEAFKMTAGSASSIGRWPANVAHDGSDEVLEAFDRFGTRTSGRLQTHHKRTGKSQIGTFDIRERTGEPCNWGGDSGSAARFFFQAKADAEDRWGSKHPTVKPIDLMRWLVRMVTPTDGIVLDPFAGSGVTGVACLAEGMRCILIEQEAEFVADIRARLAHYEGAGRHSLAVKGRRRTKTAEGLPLFAKS